MNRFTLRNLLNISKVRLPTIVSGNTSDIDLSYHIVKGLGTVIWNVIKMIGAQFQDLEALSNGHN